MSDLTDHELLAEFSRSESEEAFASLVTRYVNLVYSAALRFTGNPHHAEEITQVVFIILARKAGKISPRAVLSGWLYQTTRLAAANFMKGEIRRQRREQEAYMESTLNEPDSAVWMKIAPLLEDAMGKLGETDRNAVVLRFFENKTSAEIAVALKMTEVAARQRVSRAVEKLRKFFSKRGVVSTGAILAGAISANSVHSAPAVMAKTITAIAIMKGAAASASTLTFINGALKIMAWTKAKTAIVAGVCALLAGTTIVTISVANRPIHIQGIPKDWSMLSGDPSQWDWSNNTINGHTTNGDSLLASTRQYGNVTMSAIVSTTNREASLALRMQDADNGYIAAFCPDGTPAAKGDTAKITLLRRISGEERELVLFKRRGLSAPGQLEKFTFTANGSRLEIRLNDVTVIKTNDTTFASGFIGLRIYGDPKVPCDGMFSNLTVR